MSYRIAINGFGRIGRCVLRALFERRLDLDFQVVAINELADAKTIAHLTKFDSTHGLFPEPVHHTDDILHVGRHDIQLLTSQHPEDLNWGDFGIDLLIECTGSFSDRATAQKHIDQGAKRVLFSHPATAEIDATIVYGYNHHQLTGVETIISSASCSTNCVIPVIDTLNKALGIQSGTTWTVHSAMHDQPVIDAYHNTDLRKTRSAFNAIIPVDTGLDKGIDRLIPELKGRFQSLALRVPTVNVSAIDFALVVNKNTHVAEVNNILKSASETGFSGVVGYTEEPVASCDFNHDARSAIVDGSQTRVSGSNLIALHTWFDNEWGYANRMIDVASFWASKW